MSFFSVIRGMISDTVSRSVRSDSSTHALVGIDYDHHEIHDGTAFMAATSSGSLASAATHTLAITTPNTAVRVHITNQAESTGEVTIEWIEGVTVTVAGTALTIYNRRRDSATASACTAQINPTFTGGTTIRTFRTGSGKTIGGWLRSTSEWILQPGVTYALRVTSQAAGVYVEIKSDWYEHTDKA